MHRPICTQLGTAAWYMAVTLSAVEQGLQHCCRRGGCVHVLGDVDFCVCDPAGVATYTFYIKGYMQCTVNFMCRHGTVLWLGGGEASVQPGHLLLLRRLCIYHPSPISTLLLLYYEGQGSACGHLSHFPMGVWARQAVVSSYCMLKLGTLLVYSACVLGVPNRPWGMVPVCLRECVCCTLQDLQLNLWESSTCCLQCFMHVGRRRLKPWPSLQSMLAVDMLHVMLSGSVFLTCLSSAAWLCLIRHLPAPGSRAQGLATGPATADSLLTCCSGQMHGLGLCSFQYTIMQWLLVCLACSIDDQAVAGFGV